MTQPDTTTEWAIEHDWHKGTIHEDHRYAILDDEETARRHLAQYLKMQPDRRDTIRIVRREVTQWRPADAEQEPTS